MILLDANVLISLFRSSETLHQKAQAIFESESQFVVPYAILSEVYTVLLNRENYDFAQEVLEFLTRDPRLKILEANLSEKTKTVQFLQNNRSALSFTDALILIMCRERSLTLATFDKDLLKIYNSPPIS